MSENDPYYIWEQSAYPIFVTKKPYPPYPIHLLLSIIPYPLPYPIPNPIMIGSFLKKEMKMNFMGSATLLTLRICNILYNISSFSVINKHKWSYFNK